MLPQRRIGMFADGSGRPLGVGIQSETGMLMISAHGNANEDGQIVVLMLSFSFAGANQDNIKVIIKPEDNGYEVLKMMFENIDSAYRRGMPLCDGKHVAKRKNELRFFNDMALYYKVSKKDEMKIINDKTGIIFEYINKTNNCVPTVFISARENLNGKYAFGAMMRAYNYLNRVAMENDKELVAGRSKKITN